MTREMIRVIIPLGLKEKLLYINKLLLHYNTLECRVVCATVSLRWRWNSLHIHLFCFQKHLCLFISAQ